MRLKKGYNKMNTYCGDCNTQLIYTTSRLMIEDDSQILKVKYFGYCPHCHKLIQWIEKYQFIETTWAKEF